MIVGIAKDVANGNLSTMAKVAGDDEIAVVGKTLLHMTEKLSQRVKEVEEYGNLKTLFLATISHELRTPINIILACMQMVEKLGERHYEDIASFISSTEKYNKIQKQNCYRLLRLINNLIDINKLEANSFRLNPVNGNIVEVIEEITLSVAEYASLKKIGMVFDTDVEEKIIAFDPDIIERIILNLLSNAIKFTEPGGNIEVNICCGDEKVVISVKDSGIGIPLEKQEKIFDRFIQLDNSLTKKTEGSGIGLSLVKSLVEMHGGTISVKSEPGKGSEFVIEIPVKLATNEYTAVYARNMTLIERINIEFSDIYLQA